MTIETLLVVTPLYIYEMKIHGNTDEQKNEEKTFLPLIAFLLCISLYITIPIGYLFSKKVFNNVRERRIILYLTVICLFLNLLIINFLTANLVEYSIVFILFVIATNLLENTAITMFSKIIPSDYTVNGLNSGFIINISTIIGRILGCCIITLLGSVQPETLNFVSFGVTSGMLLISLIILVRFYSNLRVKAIARILRSRASIRKNRASEY